MKGRILIIDDTKNIRLLLGKALNGEGYEVDSADNGQDGIELFKSSSCDLVLLDIRMPGMSGTEVLKIIKDMNEEIPVVIITAYPTVKNAVDCIKLGAVDYLRKPFTSEKIKQVVKQIIDRRHISSLNTDTYQSCIEYAKKCINGRRFEEAIEYLRKAVSINIEGAEPFSIIGNVFELKGDNNGAYKYYNIAAQLEPDNETVIENINRIKSIISGQG